MEFNTSNGVVVEIKAAPFKDACNLKKAVAKAIKDAKIFNDVNTANIMDIKVDSLIQLLADIDASDEFEKTVMECLKYCIYDKGGKNIKITSQLFDDIPEAREDYYAMISKCVEVNLRPFFKSLTSEFSNRLATLPDGSPE